MKYFRRLKPIIVSLAIIIVVELLIVAVVGLKENRRVVSRDALLYLNYLKEDVGQQYIIGYKNYAFYDFNSEFVQIGDSSGFYSLKPSTVEKYLGGKKYLNLSCCGDIGWQGYYTIGEENLKRNKSRQYLVLYLTAYSLFETKTKSELSQSLHNLYSSNWRFFYTLPSIYFRKRFTEKLYYDGAKGDEYEFMKYITGKYAPGDRNYQKMMADNLGWIPYDVKPREIVRMPVGKCGKGIIPEDGKVNIDLMVRNLELIKSLADKYQVKMVLLFNPLACEASREVEEVSLGLELFKKRNPDVFVPFDLFVKWDKGSFSDAWHLTPEAAEENSARVGELLADERYGTIK